MIDELTATLTATRSIISPSTKIITHDHPPDTDRDGPSRTLRMCLRIRRLGVRIPPGAPLSPLVSALSCAQPASGPGAGVLWEPVWEPLGFSSTWDIRAAAARFWPSTRCPYTSFVMATLECPRTSETT